MIRNEGAVFIERAGHCTRCWTPFGGNLTAWMVWERTAWEIFGDGAVHQDKFTPVCDACVTPKEQARATKNSSCLGCGQRMAVDPRFAVRVCSNRCEQRERRARKRSGRRATCANCGSIFPPKRRDVRFCSNACRQAAYRRRFCHASS